MSPKKSPAKRPKPARERPSKPRPKPRRSPAKTTAAAERNVNGRAPKVEEEEAPPPAPPPPLDIPFDKKYFEAQFPNLLHPPEETNPAVHAYVVSLMIGDGMTQLDVQKIEQLDEHWLLVAVLDEDGFRPAPHSRARRYVFVPYASIARVEVSGTESRLHPIGFRRNHLADPASGKGTKPTKRAAPKGPSRPRKKSRSTKKAEEPATPPGKSPPRRRKTRG